MPKMSEPHERHLSKIIFQVSELIEKKYRAGQKEHGGNLWQKEGLIDEALNEVVDLAVYLLTLKEQVRAIKENGNLDKLIEDYERTWTALKDK